MIVQQPAGSDPGAPRFVIKNTEHQALAAGFARAFGNRHFRALEPREEMLYLVAHHDQGWQSVDDAAPIDPDTGLPYHLVRTPTDLILATGSASPDFNEAHSPFAGLLSSMHTCGLYNGRYGLSDKVRVDWIPAHSRAAVDAMLEGEHARQARLRAALPTQPWARPEHVLHCYKQLQFFDTLALYFNFTPGGARGTAVFTNVPRGVGRDVSVRVSELPDGGYAFEPFPFAREHIEVYCEGRYLAPGEGGRFASAPVARQIFTLLAA